MKRLAVGIWKCKACHKTVAGGAWTVTTTAAATVRRYVPSLSTIVVSADLRRQYHSSAARHHRGIRCFGLFYLMLSSRISSLPSYACKSNHYGTPALQNMQLCMITHARTSDVEQVEIQGKSLSFKMQCSTVLYRPSGSYVSMICRYVEGPSSPSSGSPAEPSSEPSSSSSSSSSSLSLSWKVKEMNSSPNCPSSAVSVREPVLASESALTEGAGIGSEVLFPLVEVFERGA